MPCGRLLCPADEHMPGWIPSSPGRYEGWQGFLLAMHNARWGTSWTPKHLCRRIARPTAAEAPWSQVYMGTGLTGPSMNPAVTAGWVACHKGQSLPEHLLVFWLGPLLGGAAAGEALYVCVGGQGGWLWGGGSCVSGYAFGGAIE